MGWTRHRWNYGGDNKQRRGIPIRLPNNHTSEYRRRTNKRSTDKFTPIGQCKFGVYGIGLWRRPEQTPHADNENRGMHGTYGLQFCATTKPRQLTANNGNRPRTSAWNWKVPTKPSAIQEIHRHGRSHKKSDHCGGGTIIPVPTGVPSNSIWTGVSAHHAIASINKLRYNIRNRPRKKYGENDGALWPHEAPCPIDQIVVKRERICASRRAENCRRDDGV